MKNKTYRTIHKKRTSREDEVHFQEMIHKFEHHIKTLTDDKAIDKIKGLIHDLKRHLFRAQVISKTEEESFKAA